MTHFSRLSGLMFGTALVVITGCSTMEPNPQIVQSQDRLSQAYNEKATAERGQGDLIQAKSALVLAQSEWEAGRKETSDHQVMMANTYMDLAQTRGQQALVEQDTAQLSAKMQLARKDGQIHAMDNQLAQQSQSLKDQDQALAQAKSELSEYKMVQSERGSTLVLQDVSFETGKSELLSGGVNRLQAMIRYLKLSPSTRIRIEGYTDNVGHDDDNQQLSTDRANAVKNDMMNGGIDPERIDTQGYGRQKPVASNKTVSGRQSNRRVEITLLN